MKSMTFDVLPMGLCLACLETMCDPERGRSAFHRDLGSGRAMWAIYCEHNQTGAFTFASPNQDTQWTLFTPIDIEPFLALVAKTADDVMRQLEALRVSH
jgi:hypothetical protein